ncbi:hypothetical protein AK822_08145 [Psychrobacter sp. P11F6]|uniref:dihydrolipoyl dehydrogenase family protein n=1 Tax=unclassified Psychrobacter TaxID=196806 RepID=UPI0007148017|nr:NAD(P)/FAD-dependent oxidoreductase [Psychrobacter sp. P11F6]KRG34800.1 hypothetical protein AK822_08145 [Psychrobacter sp. P11F6]
MSISDYSTSKLLYDLVVIGAGAGGLNAALTAMEYGKKVALVERNQPGGECTWSGCIPSKAMIQMAKEIKISKKYGSIEINSADVLSKVRALIQKAHQAEAVPVLEAAGIEYFYGEAVFLDKDTVQVGTNTLQAENIMIATGSSPVVPDIFGINTVNYLTNENIFLLPNLPSSIIVLGAGAIGVELSQAMQALGVEVKLVEMAPHILYREEVELSKLLQEVLEKDGVDILLNQRAIAVSEDATGIQLTLSSPEGEAIVCAEKILFALGRQPNLTTLNIADIGIKATSQGITVNDYCQTNVSNIYATGDVVGPYLFSHMAGYQARNVIHNLYGVGTQPIDLSGVAWCTFSDPEFARCGLTEVEASTEHNDIKTFTFDYEDLDRAVVDQKTIGKAKVICDNKGLILGASILGERACELLGELQLLKQNQIPLQKLQESIHPYPGYSELLFYLSMDAKACFIA